MGVYEYDSQGRIYGYGITPVRLFEYAQDNEYFYKGSITLTETGFRYIIVKKGVFAAVVEGEPSATNAGFWNFKVWRQKNLDDLDPDMLNLTLAVTSANEPPKFDDEAFVRISMNQATPDNLHKFLLDVTTRIAWLNSHRTTQKNPAMLGRQPS